MSDYIVVDLCVNDENGNHTGYVCEVQVMEMTIEGDPFEEANNPKFQRRCNGVEIEGAAYPVHAYGRYIGNIMWDACQLEPQDTARLVNQLRELKMTLTEAEQTLWDKWESGEAFTAQDFGAPSETEAERMRRIGAPTLPLLDDAQNGRKDERDENGRTTRG